MAPSVNVTRKICEKSNFFSSGSFGTGVLLGTGVAFEVGVLFGTGVFFGGAGGAFLGSGAPGGRRVMALSSKTNPEYFSPVTSSIVPAKHEIRSAKIETNPKAKMQNPKRLCVKKAAQRSRIGFGNFPILKLGFVSDFGFRVSRLYSTFDAAEVPNRSV
jgi:hypothetical protein